MKKFALITAVIALASSLMVGCGDSVAKETFVCDSCEKEVTEVKNEVEYAGATLTVCAACKDEMKQIEELFAGIPG